MQINPSLLEESQKRFEAEIKDSPLFSAIQRQSKTELMSLGTVDNQKPIEVESEERRNLRIMHIMKTSGDAASVEWERVINNSDLMQVNYLMRGLAAADAVGRVVVLSGDGSFLQYGTGFMISPRLLITNNHVLHNQQTCATSQIQFNYQYDKNGKITESFAFTLAPDEFFYTNPELDFTVVAVNEFSLEGQVPLSRFGCLYLDAKVGKVAEGEYLTIIQHPNGERKQVALRENKLVKIGEHVLWYVTDTAQGSSGSPVFNDLWQVVALHHLGVPQKDADGNILTIDGKIWREGMDETRIKWIANEGIRVSRIVTALQQAFPTHPLTVNALTQNPPLEPEISDVIVVSEPKFNPPPAPPTNGFKQSVGYSSESDGGVSLTIPLNIRVTLGDKGYTPVVTAFTDTQTGDLEEEASSIDPDYSNRSGYNPNFLGAGNRRVSLPILSAALRRKVAEVSGTTGADKDFLKYHHFSVIMNKERRLAFFTAVNIDGNLAKDIKRKNDKWIFDSRLDRAFQAGNDVYDRNALDRGHLVRRRDPVWGTTEQLARVANDDTFHFTNCSPQHKNFNQNTNTWLGLEDYILNNAIAEQLKVSVFTGHIFGNNDPQYRGIKLPKQYWKVVVIVKKGSNKLSATAYLLSQATLLRNLEDEAFSYGAYRTFQVPVKRIEALTDIQFGNLRSFDPLNNQEADVTREITELNEVIF